MSALDGLIARTCERLRILTRQMARGYPALRSVEQTDDVLQNALIRLTQRLMQEPPQSRLHFHNLAALQIRRALLEMARCLNGRNGQRPKQLTNQDEATDEKGNPLERIADSTEGPTSLAEWAEVHEQIDRLPQDDQELFDLLWYQDLTKAEAAEVLGISLRTLKRRWLLARRRLRKALGEEST
jgi:RNA polymerase sigma-70 factor (ECF subfamily)